MLLGGEGHDALRGEAGADTFEGGTGNDRFYGGTGNNLYRFGRGDGQDTVMGDEDSAADRINTIEFKEGIAPTDVVVTRNWDALELSIAGTADKIMVHGYKMLQAGR